MNGASRFTGWVLSGAVFLAFTSSLAVAQETTATESEASLVPVVFGGPNSVPGQLAADARAAEAFVDPVFLDRYFDWKDGLTAKHGFSFTLDYTAAMLAATDTITEKDAGAGGVVRFFGSWDLVGRDSDNTGSFIWKVENRHRYTDIPPSAVKNEVGYVGLILPTHSNIKTRLTNLYWKQNLREGNLEIVAGMLDVTDWVDLYALASPWTGFFNFSLATGGASIPTPDDATLGAYVNAMMTDTFYIMAGITDSNADSTDPFETFDTFFDEQEYFSSLEIGRTTSRDRFYFDNTHVTLWHVDEREAAGVSSGWGATFSYAQAIDDRWMPFLRAGYADDGGSLLQKTVSTGLGYQLRDKKSLLGVGLNWGEPNEDTFEPGLDDQFTAEMFCRFQVKQNIQITPDVQYIINPALNPESDDAWVLGVRARVVL